MQIINTQNRIHKHNNIACNPNVYSFVPLYNHLNISLSLACVQKKIKIVGIIMNENE